MHFTDRPIAISSRPHERGSAFHVPAPKDRKTTGGVILFNFFATMAPKRVAETTLGDFLENSTDNAVDVQGKRPCVACEEESDDELVQINTAQMIPLSIFELTETTANFSLREHVTIVPCSDDDRRASSLSSPLSYSRLFEDFDLTPVLNFHDFS